MVPSHSHSDGHSHTQPHTISCAFFALLPTTCRLPHGPTRTCFRAAAHASTATGCGELPVVPWHTVELLLAHASRVEGAHCRPAATACNTTNRTRARNKLFYERLAGGSSAKAFSWLEISSGPLENPDEISGAWSTQRTGGKRQQTRGRAARLTRALPPSSGTARCKMAGDHVCI